LRFGFCILRKWFVVVNKAKLKYVSNNKSGKLNLSN
jgi:hypothetical protein